MQARAVLGLARLPTSFHSPSTSTSVAPTGRLLSAVLPPTVENSQHQYSQKTSVIVEWYNENETADIETLYANVPYVDGVSQKSLTMLI